MSNRQTRLSAAEREANYRKQGGSGLTPRQRRRMKHKWTHHELQGKQARLRRRLESKERNRLRRLFGRRPK